MNIQNIQLEVIQSDIDALDVDIKITQCESLDQETVRGTVAGSLRDAQENRARSILFSDLGCRNSNVPLGGAAKIMVQEIMRYARMHPKHSLERIVFCIKEDEPFQIFDKAIRGYVKHLQEDLGPGPYVTVDIIIELEEGIVLIERSNPPYGWALPGGFLDYGESLEQAAAREAKEETNLDLVNLRQFHTYSKPGRDPRFQTVSTVFIAQGKGTPRFGDDAKNLKVARYEDLFKLEYAFDHKDIIREYREQ
jgi:ADP-ribose pyrophosphatase YjhB (NUDIX family)